MSAKPLSVVIHIDGGARGNPGPAAAGVVISAADGVSLHSEGIFLGHATNNVAEYQGLLAGLAAAANLGATEVKVISDSELLVRQMIGQYRVRNAGLLPLYRKAQELLTKFAKSSFQHVAREFNKQADHLVNQAINQRRNVQE